MNVQESFSGGCCSARHFLVATGGEYSVLLTTQGAPRDAAEYCVMPRWPPGEKQRVCRGSGFV